MLTSSAFRAADSSAPASSRTRAASLSSTPFISLILAVIAANQAAGSAPPRSASRRREIASSRIRAASSTSFPLTADSAARASSGVARA